MKSVPSLSNTSEGRQRIYKNMKYLYKAKELGLEVADKIIKKNGGKRPADLGAQVELKIGKKLDQFAKQFDWGSPKPENYLKTIAGKEQFVASGLPEGQVALNKKTGQRMVVRNGKWEKA